MIESVLPPRQFDKILAYPVPSVVDGSDLCYWEGNHDGIFTVSSAQKLIRCDLEVGDSSL